MNTPITIGDVLAVIGCLVGLALTAFGIMAFMGGAMSDAPSEGDNAGKVGCSLALAGVCILIFCIRVLL